MATETQIRTELTAAATWAAETLTRACLAHHRACCAASDRLPSPFSADLPEEGQQALMDEAGREADGEAVSYTMQRDGYLAQIGDSAQQAWVVAQIRERPECRAAAEGVLRAEGVDVLEVFAFGAFEGPRPSVRVSLPVRHDDPADAVLAIQRGEAVLVEYSQHYGIDLRVSLTEAAYTDAAWVPVTPEMRCGEARYARRLQAVARWLGGRLEALGEGDLERLGGAKALAEARLLVEDADAYESPADGYHLTEVGHLASVGRTVGVPVGEHPATDLTAYHYVAPAAYVDEWTRRMAHEYGSPPSDEGLKAAVEAHRRGDPLPPAEWAQRPAWVPPSAAPLPEDVPAYESLPRRRGAVA